ncbi:MAG: DinB family protein, partial [Acidobacteriota bacterium]|nr:DinB family protein [Acidobacteriota bacterium]
ETLKNTSDETFGQNWKLRNGEQIFLDMPKAGVIRGMVMNHIVHHRGQLSVYLRLNDIPVPALYGPSADEGQM